MVNFTGSKTFTTEPTIVLPPRISSTSRMCSICAATDPPKSPLVAGIEPIIVAIQAYSKAAIQIG